MALNQIILIMMLHLLTLKKNTISLPLPPLEAGAITQSFQATMLILPGHKPLRFAFVDSGGGLVRMHPTRELAPSLMR
jgi:hypothetical protein